MPRTDLDSSPGRWLGSSEAQGSQHMHWGSWLDSQLVQELPEAGALVPAELQRRHEAQQRLAVGVCLQGGSRVRQSCCGGESITDANEKSRLYLDGTL